MSSIVCINIFAYRPEAEMAKITLEAHGIDAVISADDCGGLHSAIGLASGGVALLVPEEKVEEAKGILEKTD